MGDRNLGGDGHTSGGSFARGQQESRDRFGNWEGAPNLRRTEPEVTGGFPRARGQVY
jgi:hypothetical protein